MKAHRVVDFTPAEAKPGSTATAKTDADPFASTELASKENTPAAKPPFAERKQALQLLKEAREHLEAGRLNEARRKPWLPNS